MSKCGSATLLIPRGGRTTSFVGLGAFLSAGNERHMNRIDLVLIARDEARCIARCLNSVRPWVDEMWLLDTGSRDDTAAIAQRCGAQVAHFDWCDDFAAARNAALALSRAEWRLVLDADEWIDGTGQALAPLRQASAPFLGQICVVSQLDAALGALDEAPSWISRVLPQGVAYAGRVHEQPQADMPRRRLDVRVLHDGYRQAQAAGKQGRNRKLLALALQAAPGDAYLHYQYGKDLELSAEYAPACQHYLQALAACAAQAGWRHDLVLRLLFSLKKCRRFEQALSLAKQEQRAFANSPDFFFTLGDVLLDQAVHEPAHGPALLPLIEQAWQQAIAIGEQPQLQDTVRGRGSYLAAHNLAVLHESLGQREHAQHWREREVLMRA